jgi:uncharacterized protein YaiI (UPF0178 family)
VKILIDGDVCPVQDGCFRQAISHGAAVATRALMESLRTGGDGIRAGPKPFSSAHRSRFLQALDRLPSRAGS